MRRKFVFFDTTANHNKVYEIKRLENGDVVAEWGRVGASMQSKNYGGASESWVESKIGEKLNKGYREVELHQVVDGAGAPVAMATEMPEVVELMQFVSAEAGKSIAGYSAVTIDQLSVGQLNKGRKILDRLRQATAFSEQVVHVGEYLNTVPTQVPFRKITEEDVVPWFVKSIADRYDQLDQLEANLAVHHAKAEGQTSLLAGLPVSIEPMSAGDDDYGHVHDYVMGTAHAGSRIRRVYRVTIDPERQAWDNETRGKDNVASLFHGTRSANIEKILRTGLIIPRIAANGSRFGRGVYMADKAQRSQNYAGSQTTNWKAMFVVDAALGKQKKMSGDDWNLTQAPAGYDSVWGVASYSGMDEFIVYAASQQTIRALVVFE